MEEIVEKVEGGEPKKMEGAAKVSLDESIELQVEDHPRRLEVGTVVQNSSADSQNSKRRKDIELGRILSPVINPVVKGVTAGVNVVADNLLPKIQRVPWHHFFILSFFVAIPAAAYILAFTKIGFGLTTFYYLSRYFEQHSYALGGSLAGFTFFLYLFDCYYWDSKYGKFARMVSLSILVLGLTLLVCFISATHPYGPISIYVVLTPVWLVCIRIAFYRKIPMRTFVPWLSGPLFLNSMVILVMWISWTWSDYANRWVPVNRLADAEVSGCSPDLEKYPECHNSSTPDIENDVCYEIVNNEYPEWTVACPNSCTKVWDTCFNQFIVWVGPFLVSLAQLFLSFFATFLRNAGTIEQEAMKFAKIWCFLLFAMWISASLAGAGAGLSTTLAALTLSSFVASAVFLASSYSVLEREEQVEQLWQKILTNYGGYLDIAKGLLVATCLPVAIVYFSLSLLVQAIRKMKRSCSKGPKNNNNESMRGIPAGHLLTYEARALIVEIRSWNLAIVYVYAVYWGAGFITLTVLAAKFTTLFLSWLIEQTETMDIGTVTAILIGVGVIMFLLPPVPGAPIYLTLGIVIVPVGRKTLGLYWCIAYAMFISLFLKLLATFLQQKMIGGLLKGSVAVRQLVGINTKLIRAMKLSLGEKGLGIAKVSILCGGPDWPTSVLCGIMDLPLLPVLVGTLPVFGLIVPTVLAGSFTYMSNTQLDDGTPEFPFAATGATICLALAAMVMMGCVLSAAYFVEQSVSTRADELDAMPFDEEVKKANEAEVAFNEAYEKVTVWAEIPALGQIMLLISLACMITACYMVQLFQEDAFVEYQLTYTIDTHLNGDWKNLVKFIGFVSIVLFCASLVFLFIFKTWAGHKARGYLKKEAEEPQDINIDVGETEDPQDANIDAVEA